jgi:tetratricopeptide (TPR) repeat protein
MDIWLPLRFTPGRLAAMKNSKPWLGGIAALLLVSGIVVLCFPVSHSDAWSALAKPGNYVALEIQHPIQGAAMPLNMPAPVLLWKTNVSGIGRWAAGFKAGGHKWFFDDIQPLWRPAEADWRRMKQAANGEPIELIVGAYETGSRGRMKARGSVRFVVAREAVESPLFYREVNLPFSEAVKDPSKIRWRFGGLDKGTLPPAVLENLPVCGNCHSFSRNGEYLAMDVDYANDKGSYLITRTAPEMKLATSDIITWDDYRREDGQPTLGLLSQISPDGRYVLSTVKDMSVFMAKPDLAFSQLFFPFKGILAVYDREAKRFSSLPGANDPALVQSNPTWSPDGQWVVFARNRAIEGKKTLEPGRILLTGEAGEEFLRQTKEYRYDLYRVPFNGGKGGKAEPLRGASLNGRSNYFPKYSPNGRWIVFCQASTYMLLQPDSELFIIPAEGGEARRLGCNLGRMNSWHSWSPDGRWLVFSSKAHSDYTQLYLTRINEKGEARPPVWLAHMVGPGRAANIPEFVALSADAIVKIREQFLDDYSWVRAGDEFDRAGEWNRAIEKYRIALSLNPDNVAAHRHLGTLLYRTNNRDEGLGHLQAVVRLEPHNPVARFDLGLVLSGRGDYSNAIVHLEEAVRRLSLGSDRQYGAVDAKPAFPEALHFNLGNVYEQVGNFANAEQHYREALRLAPDYAWVHNALGILLLRSGRIAEAEEHFVEAIRLKEYPEAHNNLGLLLFHSERIGEAEEHFREAIRLMPEFGQAHNALGGLRLRQNRRAEALDCFQKALRYDTNDWQAHMNLANTYLSEGNREKAIPELRETLRIRPSFEPAQQALAEALAQTVPNAR